MIFKMMITVFVLAVAFGTTMSQSTCSYPLCPGNSTIEYYFPNWNDCNKYWKCSNGQPIEQTCQSGMVFDFYQFTCVPRPTSFADIRYTCDIFLNGFGSLFG